MSTGGPATDSDTATLTIVLINLPPSADAGPDQTADEGQLVSFDGSASDPEGLPLEIGWDFGDGLTASGSLTPTHTYADDDQHIVTLVVTDSAGLTASDTMTVTVNNVDPLVDAGANQNVTEGEVVSLDPASFSDPGSADTHTATINWGDGVIEPGIVNQAAGTVSGNHTYSDNGIFTVTVTVNDDDGGGGADTFSVTVVNAAPSVDAGNDQMVTVGDTVFLDPATLSDPGTADTHTATIDWGDGTVEAGIVNQAAGTVSGSHIYTTDGVYTVMVTVIDDDGGQSSDTFTVTVALSLGLIYIPITFNGS